MRTDPSLLERLAPWTMQLTFLERMQMACKFAKVRGGVFNQEALIAQSALESGYGTSPLARRTLNILSVKASPPWEGPTFSLSSKEFINGQWTEHVSKFRVYRSYQEAILDYCEFLKSRWWYADVLPHADEPDGDGDTFEWIAHLVDQDEPGEKRYANDPLYVSIVMRVVAEIRLEMA